MNRLQRFRVAVVTGTRADYGLLQSPMRAIADHPRLQLQLVVAGMHLLDRFGRTENAIKKDGWSIDARIPMQRGDDDDLDQAQGLSRGVKRMAEYFLAFGADIVVVLGDRIEALAGALASVATGRFTAHIHGGDTAPGDRDEYFRDAITKLSDLHLTATHRSRERVVSMGEGVDSVFVVGAPGLDRLYGIRSELPSSGEVAIRRTRPLRGANRRKCALVIQHPCGRSAETEKRTMQHLLGAVADADLDATVLYPNTDRGHSGIIEAIEHCPNASSRRIGTVSATVNPMDRPPQFKVFPSLERDAFLRTLITADVLVGNSSAGVIEAPAAGTPVVDIGPRQDGRELGGPHVFRTGERRSEILVAIRKALGVNRCAAAASPYGDGRAGEAIAERIAEFLGSQVRQDQNHTNPSAPRNRKKLKSISPASSPQFARRHRRIAIQTD